MTENDTAEQAARTFSDREMFNIKPLDDISLSQATVALEGANGHIVRCHMENRRLQQDGVFGTKAHLERVLKSQRDRRLRVEKAAVIIQAFLRTTAVRVKVCVFKM